MKRSASGKLSLVDINSLALFGEDVIFYFVFSSGLHLTTYTTEGKLRASGQFSQVSGNQPIETRKPTAPDLVHSRSPQINLTSKSVLSTISITYHACLTTVSKYDIANESRRAQPREIYYFRGFYDCGQTRSTNC